MRQIDGDAVYEMIDKRLHEEHNDLDRYFNMGMKYAQDLITFSPVIGTTSLGCWIYKN